MKKMKKEINLKELTKKVATLLQEQGVPTQTDQLVSEVNEIRLSPVSPLIDWLKDLMLTARRNGINPIGKKEVETIKKLILPTIDDTDDKELMSLIILVVIIIVIDIDIHFY